MGVTKGEVYVFEKYRLHITKVNRLSFRYKLYQSGSLIESGRDDTNHLVAIWKLDEASRVKRILTKYGNI
jgi:hypothetical protein